MPNVCTEWHTEYRDDGIALRCGRFRTVLPWPLVERVVTKPPKAQTFTYLGDGTFLDLYPNGLRVHAGKWGSRIVWPTIQLKAALRERDAVSSFVG
jgi:hypothetical protein